MIGGWRFEGLAWTYKMDPKLMYQPDLKKLESISEFLSPGEAHSTSHRMHTMEVLPSKEVVILGAGLAGLSAGYILSKSGRSVIVLEGDTNVGGLSKTITHGDFKFDLGGHRFLTTNKRIEQFVMGILKGDFLVVARKSKIYMFKKYFDYPLKPTNAIFGLGPYTTLQIVWDYLREKINKIFRPSPIVSLEDWVINRFGTRMFELYFKQYSEKVWGMECGRISQEWVAQRIKGLSLLTAIKNGLFRSGRRDIPTLSDQFIYPIMGIGQISERLREGIEAGNPVMTKTMVKQINHGAFLIKGVIVENNNHIYKAEGHQIVSTIPLPNFLQMLQPAPPKDIVEAASRLKYRDIIIVTIMLNRQRVTDNTWIYLPEKAVPMARIHEPQNWSPHTTPKGNTHLVSEYFCSKDDGIWSLADEELTAMTLKYLEKLGFINESDIIDSCVARVANAYPVFEVGYLQYYSKVFKYLRSFKNLHIIGRAGMFRYYNMDHAMESGINAAEAILAGQPLEKMPS